MTSGTEQRRVLIVEDEATTREGLADILRLKGFEVVSAENGREGLEQLRVYRPDTVLLDLVMPVMSGLGFLGQCKSDPLLARTPVVVMTALGNGGAALQVDAEAIITKPFDPDFVLRLVEHLVAPGIKKGC